jgi:HK97 gp10 family phage protein
MGVEIAFTENVSGVMKKIDDTARERMWEAVNSVRNTTLENLSGQRSGRQYYVPGTKTKYTASAKDEYPAVATGQLWQSIKATIEVDGSQVAIKTWQEESPPSPGSGKNILGLVGTELNYGPMLEFGTSKMKARPWLRRTFESLESNLKEIFVRAWF